MRFDLRQGLNLKWAREKAFSFEATHEGGLIGVFLYLGSGESVNHRPAASLGAVYARVAIREGVSPRGRRELDQ